MLPPIQSPRWCYDHAVIELKSKPNFIKKLRQQQLSFSQSFSDWLGLNRRPIQNFGLPLLAHQLHLNLAAGDVEEGRDVGESEALAEGRAEAT